MRQFSTISRLCSILVLIILCAFSTGCLGGIQSRDEALKAAARPTPATIATGSRRADPGYIQYLERLSMLGSQTELARVVSGSQIGWLRPADPPFPDPLLDIADTWLVINPLTVLTESKKNVFTSLAMPQYWQIFTRSRMGGIYFSPISGAGALWAYNRKTSLRGDDIIQYAYSDAAGTERDYLTLLSVANNNRKLIGMDLTPATTGLGPDFFLATRNHRQFSGAYCMIELPKPFWQAMPEVTDQWHGVALEPMHISMLNKNKILPSSLVQDSFPKNTHFGWAVTAEIHGVDGLIRRWIYRFNKFPDHPVLNWEDPSGSAKKIFSGSAIRSVGMFGGALVGISLDGLYGLDVAMTEGGATRAASPGDLAAVAISREIRKYGGWSWLRDELPLRLIKKLSDAGPDFFTDSVYAPGIEHAMLTGSTNLLNTMADEALTLGLDMRRFVHATIGTGGVNYGLPHLAFAAREIFPAAALTAKQAFALESATQAEIKNVLFSSKLSSQRGDDIPPLKENKLFTTSAGIAALALGAGNAETVTDAMHGPIQDGHLLQIFFRAMLPGLFVLSGQDMAGTLPVSWYHVSGSPDGWDVALASRGAYALTESAQENSITPQGIAKAKSVYPSAEMQLNDEKSFVASLTKILGVRTALNIANSRVYGRFITNTPGSFALALLLPASGREKAELFPQKLSATTAAAEDGAFYMMAPPTGSMAADDRVALQRQEQERARERMEWRIITAASSPKTSWKSDAALITVANFSRDPVQEVFDLSRIPKLMRIMELRAPVVMAKSGKETDKLTVSFSKQTITVTLPLGTG